MIFFNQLAILPKADREEVVRLLNAKLQAAQEERKSLLEQLAKADKVIETYQGLIELVLGGSPAKPLLPDLRHIFTSQDELQKPATQAEPTRDNERASGQQGEAVKPAEEEAYQVDWPNARKVAYVLRQPGKYGFTTFVGAGAIVEAIVTEEPEWLRTASRESIREKIAPTLSRMVARGEVVKLTSRTSQNVFHFISADWYDADGRVKPEYQGLVAGLLRVGDR